jgi:hypothetical protein
MLRNESETNYSHITVEMIKIIDDAICAVLSQSSFGKVIIDIEKGQLRWVTPAPSLPIAPVTPATLERR